MYPYYGKREFYDTDGNENPAGKDLCMRDREWYIHKGKNLHFAIVVSFTKAVLITFPALKNARANGLGYAREAVCKYPP